MASTSITARRVANRLQQHKDNLQREVKTLAHDTLKRQLPRGYEFQEAGSFWSPLLHDVTDVDVTFFPRKGSYLSAMPPQDAELLHNVAARVLEATLKYRIVTARPGGCDIEEEHEDWASCRRAMQAPGRHLQTVVASGIYLSKRCRILVPMDITLSCGTRRESISHRLDKIVKKVREGNYAKVLQKVRQVVKRDKPTRAALVERVNADVGWWRCAATQMEVLQRSFNTVPRQAWLRAAGVMPGGPHDLGTLAQLQIFFDVEAQKAARRVLVDLGDRIAMSFGSPVDRSRFLEAIQAR